MNGGSARKPVLQHRFAGRVGRLDRKADKNAPVDAGRRRLPLVSDKKQLRAIDAPFVALGPSGVSIRDRLKGLTPQDEKVLRLVGAHLGSLASRDLKARCADGPDPF